jgi:8-oxo-dGTP pyrophosphatase MutT (NUDIX family)
MRHSHVVYVLIRLPTLDGPVQLLRRHEKWGDWSLVGGHVEDDEMDDWAAAAVREAKEELEPLVPGEDFRVTPMHAEPFVWGPEASRSALHVRTIYHIQYYGLAFLRDPAELLPRLPAAEFLLVPERELGTTAHALGSPVHRAQRSLPGGLPAVPVAWGEALDPAVLPAALLRPLTRDPSAAPPG